LLEDEGCFARFINVAESIANAEIPKRIATAIALGNITALQKEDGGVRGIVTGDTTRRLVSRSLAQQYGSQIEEACFPFQFALGTRAGTDAAVLFLRTYLENNPGKVLVSIDGIGAYDHIYRASMLEKLADTPGAKEMLPFVSLFYRETSTYLWTDENGDVLEIKQGEGGEQGDALMPALFALGLHGALAASKLALPFGVEILAYLDDVYIVADRSNAAEAFRVTTQNITEMAGVRTHMGKLKVWSAHGGLVPPGLPVESWICNDTVEDNQNGIKVLGSPIGTDAYIRDFCSKRVEEKENPFLVALAELSDPQVAWVLARYCAEPRFNHLLRTVPPTLVGDGAERHDAGLRKLAAAILRVPVSSLERGPASFLISLPGRHGGCGLRLATRTAVAAYWGGWASALPLLFKRFSSIVEPWGSETNENVPSAVQAFREADVRLREEGAVNLPSWAELCRGAMPPQLDPNELPEVGEFRHGWQFLCSKTREKSAAESFIQNSDESTVAQVWSQAGPGAAAFLTARPDEIRRIYPPEFQIAMRRRLRLPVPVTGLTCPGSHNPPVPLDPYGDHLCSCMTAGRIQRRALAFERAWEQVFREGGASVQPKPYVRDLGLEGTDVNDQRRLDFLATGTTVHGGIPLACDATLGSVLNCTGRRHAGDVFKIARARKESKYSDVHESGRVSLVVLAALSGGRFSKESAQIVRSLVQQKTEAAPPLLRGTFRQAYFHRWWSVLSCAVQRSVAAGLRHTFAPVAGPWGVPPDFLVIEEVQEAPAFSRLGP
jgi:hypothetical protein